MDGFHGRDGNGRLASNNRSCSTADDSVGSESGPESSNDSCTYSSTDSDSELEYDEVEDDENKWDAEGEGSECGDAGCGYAGRCGTIGYVSCEGNGIDCIAGYCVVDSAEYGMY